MDGEEPRSIRPQCIAIRKALAFLRLASIRLMLQIPLDVPGQTLTSANQAKP